MPADQADSPRPPGGDSKRRGFKRGYVACIACRSRKVRCVIDSEPPCARCRREHRNCLFDAHPKSLHGREPPRWARQTRAADEAVVVDLAQNSTPQQESAQHTETRPPQSSHSDTMSPPAISRHSAFGGLPLAQASPAATASSLSERVASAAMNRPSDALEVLFDAVNSSAHTHEQLFPGGSAEAAPLVSQPVQNLATGVGDRAASASSPLLTQFAITKLSVPENESLDWWDKSRFVRMGWLTGQEAVTYLDLFYEHIAPYAPVITDAFRTHDKHRYLITSEPMLLTTMLMISSRFFTLPGPGGTSRSHFIHQRFWSYCELLIRRVMFGQEKHATAKVRIVGTIESLILIADWHPRALHFPPETEGWDGELISDTYDRHNRLQQQGEAPLIRWREDVFEPARRSDRMSWMLLGAATNLAYELGVFSDNASPPSEPSGSEDRVARVRRLLYIYVTQLSVRLGFASILPQNISFHATAPSPIALPTIDQNYSEVFVGSWMELVQLAKTASAMFFQSSAFTKQQLLSGHYATLLNHFAPSLTRWYDNFMATSFGLPEDLQNLLLFEYRYLKISTNALSLQAIVERAVTRGISNITRDHDDVQATCFHTHDHKFIQQVLQDCEKILQTATCMSKDGRLRFCPLRTLLCITSSSIVLLKALSLGARCSDLKASLSILDDAISALRASPIDDMDFSSRYAVLLEKHVANFRANFTAPISGDQVQGSSRTGSGRISVAMKDALNEDSLLLPQTPSALLGDGPTIDAFNTANLSIDDDWFVRPFDPSIAPFSAIGDHMSLGFELDSLDFLWNIGDAEAA